MNKYPLTVLGAAVLQALLCGGNGGGGGGGGAGRLPLVAFSAEASSCSSSAGFASRAFPSAFDGACWQHSQLSNHFASSAAVLAVPQTPN